MSKLPVTCKICNKVLQEKNLANHISVVHEKNKAFKCELCSHSCSTKKFLQTHQLLYHKNDQTKIADNTKPAEENKSGNETSIKRAKMAVNTRKKEGNIAHCKF